MPPWIALVQKLALTARLQRCKSPIQGAARSPKLHWCKIWPTTTLNSGTATQKSCPRELPGPGLHRCKNLPRRGGRLGQALQLAEDRSRT